MWVQGPTPQLTRYASPVPPAATAPTWRTARGSVATRRVSRAGPGAAQLPWPRRPDPRLSPLSDIFIWRRLPCG